MTDVFVIPLISDTDFEALSSSLNRLVPYEIREKAGRFARIRDSQRSLVGEVAMRFLLGQATGNDYAGRSFPSGEKGKPAPWGIDGIFLNMSHSGDWVAVALSPLPVGVDVEMMRKVPEGVAYRFFSPAEKKWLQQARDEDEKAHIFFTLWTLKESFLKATGKGLTKSLSSFTVVQQRNGGFRLTDDPEAEGYFLKNLPFEQGYKLSVCSREPEFCNEVKILKITDLIP